MKPSQATLLASIPQRSSVPFHFALSGGDDEMTGVIDLRTTGPGQISGTTDMTSMTGFTFLRRDHFAALGGGAREVPFTAALDGQGRLSSLAVQVPAGGRFAAATYRAAYTDYGSTTRPEPPAAGDQIPAPDATYELFRGVQYAGPDVG